MTEQQIKRLQELLRKRDSLENFIEYREWGVIAMGQIESMTKKFDVAPNAMIQDKEICDRLVALAAIMLKEVNDEIEAL